jgi:hypothetical protein
MEYTFRDPSLLHVTPKSISPVFVKVSRAHISILIDGYRIPHFCCSTLWVSVHHHNTFPVRYPITDLVNQIESQILTKSNDRNYQPSGITDHIRRSRQKVIRLFGNISAESHRSGTATKYSAQTLKSESFSSCHRHRPPER